MSRCFATMTGTLPYLLLMLVGGTPLLADELEDKEDAPFKRVVPVFDPGSHVRPILDLGFSADGKKLITAGRDYTIRVWSVMTGERLDVLRLPPYGHEEGFNAKEWGVAAISPDGKLVAVGGGQKLALSPDNATDRAKLVLVDLEKRSLRRMVTNGGRSVTALAFSANGSILAVAHDGAESTVHLLEGLDGTKRPKGQRRSRRELKSASKAKLLQLEFSPDGTRLVASGNGGLLCGWDLSKDREETAFSLELPPETSSLAWAPDSKSFVRTRIGVGGSGQALEWRSADGTLLKEWTAGDGDMLDQRVYPWHAVWTGDNELFVAANTGPNLSAGAGTDQQAGKASALQMDLKAGRSRTIAEFDGGGRFSPIGELSPDRSLGVITVDGGLDAVVFRTKDGSEVSRCGAKSPIPSVVGWSKRGSPRIAWSESHVPGRMNTDPQQFEVAFDLEKLELTSEFTPDDFQTCCITHNDWSLSAGRAGPNIVDLLKNGELQHEFRVGNRLSAATLIPRASEPPRVLLFGKQPFAGKSQFVLAEANGDLVAQLLPAPVTVRDVAPSPDNRYVVASTGTHRLCIYRTDGSAYPVLNVARVRGDWVAWTASGHFVGSPGGERMFGWAVNSGHDAFATFYPAEKFSKQFRRPEELVRAIDHGVAAAAPEKIEERSPDFATILPPRAALTLVKQTETKVQVRGEATAESPKRPVKSMRLLLDGKAIPGAAGLYAVKPGQSAATTWDIELPPGPHELKLLAKDDDGAAVSEPLRVVGPKSVASQPTLHRLCVGVGEYRNRAYNLDSAGKDAIDLYAALERHCVGPGNRFGKATGKLLTNKDATREAVLVAITSIRKAAKPGDLVVFQFAGHGVRQESEYFLMTTEADPSTTLIGKAVSGQDLRDAFVSTECPILLLLDACHSAAGAQALLPVTNDLTRQLADESAGVTVMAAAMAHEKASGTERNGYFTAALLKGLAVEPDAFDPYDHILYTHHVYSVVFSEVRRASRGRQNPCLTTPWTMSPLGLRESSPP
jgi:WD40 repeat protein